MSKNTYPPPTYADIIAYLPVPRDTRIAFQLSIRPAGGRGAHHITCEALYRHSNGQQSVMYRTGETLSILKPDLIQGCYFRAAFRMRNWFEAGTEEERIKYHLWTTDSQP